MTPLFECSQLAAGHGFAVRPPPLLTLVLECVRETRLRRCAPHPRARSLRSRARDYGLRLRRSSSPCKRDGWRS
jgi:hypothetical protein